MEKPEESRGRWALGLTVAFTVVIFFSFALHEGFVSFGNKGKIAEQKKETQVANVASSKAPSPIESSKETFKAAFKEIGDQYTELKETILNVFVPFISGIEVYERE